MLLSLPASPNGPVNDYAGVLSPVQLSQLDAQLRGYERGTTRQIAVAIFRSLEGESLEDVSMRLAEKWKIGGKQSNDGVLLTLFLDDHKLRIEVGYGLEGALTDITARRIIDEEFQSPCDLYRAGMASEIGPVIAFLASKRNSYMTGANVNVDGGSDFA